MERSGFAERVEIEERLAAEPIVLYLDALRPLIHAKAKDGITGAVRCGADPIARFLVGTARRAARLQLLPRHIDGPSARSPHPVAQG